MIVIVRNPIDIFPSFASLVNCCSHSLVPEQSYDELVAIIEAGEFQLVSFFFRVFFVKLPVYCPNFILKLFTRKLKRKPNWKCLRNASNHAMNQNIYQRKI